MFIRIGKKTLITLVSVALQSWNCWSRWLKCQIVAELKVSVQIKTLLKKV